MRIARDKTAEERNGWLLDSLQSGKDHAISQKNLCIRLGLKPAELRDAILKARIDGCFICSCQEGYYLPADRLELYDHARRRETVINTAEKAVHPFLEELLGEPEAEPLESVAEYEQLCIDELTRSGDDPND